MRPTIILRLAQIALVAVFVGGCQKPNQTGEAFAALKSGEVVYMADMEVLCFSKSFKSVFQNWQSQCNKEVKLLIDQAEAEKSDQLNKIQLETKQNILEQQAIAIETARTINNYIETNGLEIQTIKIEELDNPEYDLFAWVTEFTRAGRRPLCWNGLLGDSFLVKTTDDTEQKGYTKWKFYYHIPKQLEGTAIESLIKDKGEISEGLRSKGHALRNSIESPNIEMAKKISGLKLKNTRDFYAFVKEQAIAVLRTGSKGDFVVPGEAAYLFAETHRDNGEKLAWLLRVDPKSPKVKMSVSNAASAGGSGDFDSLWMLRWNLD